MIPFLCFLAGIAATILGGCATVWWRSIDCVEQTCGGELHMECRRCGTTCHVMPGTRVTDAIETRRTFLVQHIMCGRNIDDRGVVFHDL